MEYAPRLTSSEGTLAPGGWAAHEERAVRARAGGDRRGGAGRVGSELVGAAGTCGVAELHGRRPRPHPAAFRVGAALLGAAAIVLVALACAGIANRLAWVVIAVLGLGGIALGVAGFRAVEGYHGFGSLVANDMTLSGFHHGPLNYVELVG